MEAGGGEERGTTQSVTLATPLWRCAAYWWFKLLVVYPRPMSAAGMSLLVSGFKEELGMG